MMILRSVDAGGASAAHAKADAAVAPETRALGRDPKSRGQSLGKLRQWGVAIASTAIISRSVPRLARPSDEASLNPPVIVTA
jgi:hypothetical protein